MPGDEMDSVERAAVAKSDFVTPDLAKNKTKDTINIAHNDQLGETREPYGPAGKVPNLEGVGTMY